MSDPEDPQPRESWRRRLLRYGFNLHPALRGMGLWVTFIADGWTELKIRLPLSWRTRNIVGTTFGGSLYGSVDPFYMILLMKQLGDDYVVWDKAATIRFRRPGRSTLYATFRMPPEEVQRIREVVERDGRAEPTYTVELVDSEGVVHASCDKTLSIRAHPSSGV